MTWITRIKGVNFTNRKTNKIPNKMKYRIIFFSLLIVSIIASIVGCQDDFVVDDTTTEIVTMNSLDEVIPEVNDKIEDDHVLLNRSMLQTDGVCIAVGRYVLDLGGDFIFKRNEPLLLVLIVENLGTEDASNVTLFESSFLTAFDENIQPITVSDFIEMPVSLNSNEFENGVWEIDAIPSGGRYIGLVQYTIPDFDASFHAIGLDLRANFVNSSEFELGRSDGESCINNQSRNTIAVVQ